MQPDLPTELWRLIIQHALPTQLSRNRVWMSNTWTKHSQLLRTCCLVSSTWRDIAQPLLFEQAFVSDSTIDDFFNSLSTEPHLKTAVRVLKVSRKVDRLTLGATLELLPGLRELYLTQAGEFDLSLLRAVPNLTKLVGWGVELDLLSSSPFSLPSLTEISFCGTAFRRSARHLFHPSYLPNLRAIAICYPRTTQADGTDVTASHLLDAFPPSLFVLTTVNPRTGLPSPETAPHTVYTLREEALDWSDVSLGIRCESGPIRHLHLHEVPNAIATGVSPMLETDPALEHLETLYLALEQGSDLASLNYQAYREYGQRRGVEVVFTVEQEFMEDSLLDPVLLRRHAGEGNDA